MHRPRWRMQFEPVLRQWRFLSIEFLRVDSFDPRPSSSAIELLPAESRAARRSSYYTKTSYQVTHVSLNT